PRSCSPPLSPLLLPSPPSPTLFPYTTLFRSGPPLESDLGQRDERLRGERLRPERLRRLDLLWLRLRPVGLRHQRLCPERLRHQRDRKITRLNSSHGSISYAVFCLKKKKTDHRKTLLAATRSRRTVGIWQEVVGYAVTAGCDSRVLPASLELGERVEAVRMMLSSTR